MGGSSAPSNAGLGLSALAAFRGSIALVGTVAYVAFFALGAGAVPGLLVPEITPAKLRGTPWGSHTHRANAIVAPKQSALSLLLHLLL